MMILKLKKKPIWKVSQGEQPHKRGEVFADKRTKKLRTRQAQRARWMAE